MARTAARVRIALVTYRPEEGAENMDRDLPVLKGALEGAGADVVVACWDDVDVDWAGFDLAVIRSTWDYSWQVAEFVAWAERCGKLTRLANPAEVVRWNTDKRYIGELGEAGVPVVPTRYVAPGDPIDLPSEYEFVVKPTSGAGARLAARYTPGERETAVRHVERLHAKGLTAMVQPYLARIDTAGERALQFFGGRFLHASRKGAVLEPGTAYDADKVPHPRLAAWTPTPAELSVAERALAAVPHGIQGPGAPELLYARVDLVDGDDGEPVVMELELVEPNLFLWLHPESLPKVVAAITAAAL